VSRDDRYTLEDYLNTMSDAGFSALTWQEHRGDQTLAEEVPWSSKYSGRPLLLLVRAERGG
jgi:hypothetical protein